MQPAVAAPSCSVSSTTTVTFSSYDVFSASNDNSTGGGATILCNGNTTAVMSLTKGSSGTYTARTMSGPGGVLLNYNLYTTAALTTVWGDGTGGTSTVSMSAIKNVAKAVTIYGLIPKNQYAAVAGAYTDTITFSVTP